MKTQKEMIGEMHSIIVNRPPLTQEVADEIFLAIIARKTSPSQALIRFMAQHSSRSMEAIRAHFRGLYYEATGNDDDPFEEKPFMADD